MLMDVQAAGSLRTREAQSLPGIGTPQRSHSLSPVSRQHADQSALKAAEHSVAAQPADGVTRLGATWSGMAAEIVHLTGQDEVVLQFCAPVHLLALFECGVRHEGETTVEDVRSSLHDVTRKLVFVPAGRTYRDCYRPRSAIRVIFFYLPPDALSAGNATEARAEAPDARLFFEDATLLSTAQKLAALIEAGATEHNNGYLEALGRVLAHELFLPRRGAQAPKSVFRGGLAAWQQRRVASFIEENLAEPITLAALAQLVNLSPYHFCRAFKQSFGLPPHRYHTNRRIERAKTLLASQQYSVTEIGLRVGFCETSSFTAAFRKATGLTPTAYVRSLS